MSQNSKAKRDAKKKAQRKAGMKQQAKQPGLVGAIGPAGLKTIADEQDITIPEVIQFLKMCDKLGDS